MGRSRRFAHSHAGIHGGNASGHPIASTNQNPTSGPSSEVDSVFAADLPDGWSSSEPSSDSTTADQIDHLFEAVEAFLPEDSAASVNHFDLDATKRLEDSVVPSETDTENPVVEPTPATNPTHSVADFNWPTAAVMDNATSQVTVQEPSEPRIFPVTNTDLAAHPIHGPPAAASAGNNAVNGGIKGSGSSDPSDSAVDVDDYALWKSTFGSTTELAADGNGNGVIDAGDYTIYRDNLGTTSGMAVATSSILGNEAATVSEEVEIATGQVGVTAAAQAYSTAVTVETAHDNEATLTAISNAYRGIRVRAPDPVEQIFANLNWLAVSSSARPYFHKQPCRADECH